MLTRSCHYFPSSDKLIQTTPSHFISLGFILLMSFHLWLGLSCGLFLWAAQIELPTNLSRLRCMLHAPCISSNLAEGYMQITKLLTMHFSPASCSFLRLRCKSFLCTLFFTLNVCLSFTSTHTTDKTGVVCFDACIFRQEMRKQNILNLMAASIPWI